jgi:PleD family two-component response regulator
VNTPASRERLRAFPYPISAFLTMPLVGCGGSVASMTSHLHLAASDGESDGERLPITVVLADDHAMFRRTLRRLLDVEETISVVAEPSDLPSAIDYVERRRPRVLVLDLDMSNGSTLEAIRQLRTDLPGPRPSC